MFRCERVFAGRGLQPRPKHSSAVIRKASRTGLQTPSDKKSQVCMTDSFITPGPKQSRRICQSNGSIFDLLYMAEFFLSPTSFANSQTKASIFPP